MKTAVGTPWRWHPTPPPGDWRFEGACHNQPELVPVFFPAGEGSGDKASPTVQTAWAKAKRICALCPVSTECQEYALETRQEHGVWGGLTPPELRRLRRVWLRQRRSAS